MRPSKQTEVTSSDDARLAGVRSRAGGARASTRRGGQPRGPVGALIGGERRSRSPHGAWARWLVGAALSLLAARAWGADEALRVEGVVPEGPDHFFVDFDVPEGIVEIEVAHATDHPEAVLDFGLDGPAGSLGWGGGNPEPARVGARSASRSYRAGPLPAGVYRVVVGKARLPAAPAEVGWRLDIALRGAETAAAELERRPYTPSPPLRSGPAWYAGDLHVHSRESGDASPSIDEVAAFAAGRGLDFVVLSEHNTTAHGQWLGSAQARWPALLLVPGIEFTTYDGHAGAFGATEWVDHRIGQPGATIEAAAAAIHDQDALLIVNHPNLALGGACIGCAWEHALDPADIDAVEIITGGWSPAGQLFFDANLATWEGWLDAGARVAPVGGSDDHRAGAGTGATDSPIGSPTTLIYAESLSVEGLRAGLAAGRTVVKLQGPGDPMIELWPEPRPPLGDDPPAGARFEATVTGGAGATLEWVEDGAVVSSEVVSGESTTLAWRMSPGARRLRAQLRVDGAPRVVTGHWFAGAALDEDSGGQENLSKTQPGACACGGEGSAAGLGALGLLAALLRRRRAQPGRPRPR